MTYRNHIGTNDIYTSNGDYVGSIEDADLRDAALEGLNSQDITSEQKKMLKELDDNGVDDIRTAREIIEMNNLVKEHDYTLKTLKPILEFLAEKDLTIKQLKEMIELAEIL